jgi:hypothetical protein
MGRRPVLSAQPPHQALLARGAHQLFVDVVQLVAG